jgi:acetylornithine/succinyldiaminopimelate/putrescine aminotransferase
MRASVRLLLFQQTAPTNTTAIVIEPVPGEVVRSDHVLALPVSLQDGLLLIVDDVQSGFGRTGWVSSVEHSGVRLYIMLITEV